MDYHTIHGHDVEGFGTPLTHRVLTVSAADVDAALLSPSPASSTGPDLTTPARLVPTGISTLDSILSDSPAPHAGAGDATEDGDEAETEAKAGTTSDLEPLSILAANALSGGSSAVWVDCFHSLCRERLTAIAEAHTGPDKGAKSVEEGFVHYTCPSLPHFIAMFCPSTSVSTVEIPADASVVVIDSLSALVNHALPRTVEKKGAPLMANGKRGPAAHEKRTQVLQYIVAALERLAETQNVAVILLTQCASRVQADGGGAALVPAINAAVWDRGIATRIVLFRDWAWKDGEAVGGRFAGIQKLNRSGGDTALSHVVAFSIAEASLLSTNLRILF
ncbi:hypothetical protein CMQ_3380 [Grosmannia clavigera kw1407]|uniref:Uncharacterized protein n=1 Tax=Grosmannia clavigera (strain kw1407 / UAMH 11150) TaxID=655863 RepID=F0X948_GROCL|nr:uncharacterized protein CMQ_3380 [Grosmannia clavigera kw1407]EFX05311.1 hypothetical protein CMQ_3380 [Grosmannia clavigera kw1407]